MPMLIRIDCILGKTLFARLEICAGLPEPQLLSGNEAPPGWFGNGSTNMWQNLYGTIYGGALSLNKNGQSRTLEIEVDNASNRLVNQ